jgi:hypothetical protein
MWWKSRRIKEEDWRGEMAKPPVSMGLDLVAAVISDGFVQE